MEVLRTAILEMCRQTKKDGFYPAEVLKLMFPQDWEQFLEEIITVALEMYKEGLIQITQNGMPIDSDSVPKGPIMISRNPNQSKR
ncbi:MAG: DUF3253 domain-containing protein [Algoriphagus sp.]|nr:DUF3253 domain-containing protein [Algoriphagus sp.]